MSGIQRISANLSEELCSEQDLQYKQRGLTLIELMVVIGIIAVLAIVANGAYGSVRDRTRAETAAQELRSVLTSARLAALSTGQAVQVTLNYASASTAALKNSISATHLGGVYSNVSPKKVTGNERTQEGVYWFKASTAGNSCVKATGGTMKTIGFSPRASVTDLTDGGTPSVVVSSDAAGTKDLHCLQVRVVTGRVVVIKP